MKNLKLNDGGRLKYEDEGSGRPIVLLHGWGMRGECFRPQITALSPKYRVIAPDLRGHGQSSPLTDGHGLETLMDDVTELLVRLNLSESLLVGWSMGAMVAWGVMRHKAAARITGLVTIDMVPKLLNDKDWRFGLRDGEDASVFSAVAARMIEDWPGFTKVFVPRIFARGQQEACKALAERIEDKAQKNDPESMARLWMSMVEQDFRSQLSQISTQTLVVRGALSQLYCEEASHWIVRQMPNAKPVNFAHSGHALHLEEADLFNQVIEEFADATRQ